MPDLLFQGVCPFETGNHALRVADLGRIDRQILAGREPLNVASVAFPIIAQLAVLAILPHFYTWRHPRRWAVLIPLLVLAIPLMDLGWVVVLRSRAGQPFYQGDLNHLSHRLVRTGLTPTQAVLLIWVVAAALGAEAES